jgi:2Fe-2S ferredoxin
MVTPAERTRRVPKVTYVAADGTHSSFDAAVGESVMTVAVQNGVAGIIGECGGNRSCATCHIWVRDDYLEIVGPARDLEDDMLDLAVAERRVGSRLGCQVQITDELDGLTVDIPPEQP